ncbi:MAG TPA: hypothetical protein VIQ24_07855 [Pyrinomonadaceae bacterium]
MKNSLRINAGRRYGRALAALPARKLAAALQAANRSPHPILLRRVETKAGHGAGKPLAKQVAEATDVWSFLFWQLGMSA